MQEHLELKDKLMRTNLMIMILRYNIK